MQTLSRAPSSSQHTQRAEHSPANKRSYENLIKSVKSYNYSDARNLGSVDLKPAFEFEHHTGCFTTVRGKMERSKTERAGAAAPWQRKGLTS